MMTEAGLFIINTGGITMDLLIGENIRRFRRKKNITQEKLAEHLNISCPAVSKWERNEACPDITMIIPLASYFGVTTDELLGFDAAKSEVKIQKYLSDYNDLVVSANCNKAGELITKAHNEFPNDFRIIHLYMLHIIGGYADNDAKTILERADELTSLCSRVLDECTVDSIRNDAIDILAKIYKAQGKVEKALELLSRFPDWFGCTRGQKSEQLFEKNTEEWWYWLHVNIFQLAGFTFDKVQKAIWVSCEEPFEQKVETTLRLIGFLKKICTETNYEPGFYYISQAYSKIAEGHNHIGDFENVFHYNDLSLEYAKKFDDFVESDRHLPHTSDNFKFALQSNFNQSGRKYNLVKIKLIWLEGTPMYMKFRKTMEYAEMVERFQPFAHDYLK